MACTQPPPSWAGLSRRLERWRFDGTSMAVEWSDDLQRGL